MLIDCATCVARHVACRDCIVTVLLAQPAPAADPSQFDNPLELDQDERDALGTLARAGLVAPLRLVRALPDSRANIRDTA
jgi:hypothetical protein